MTMPVEEFCTKELKKVEEKIQAANEVILECQRKEDEATAVKQELQLRSIILQAIKCKEGQPLHFIALYAEGLAIGLKVNLSEETAKTMVTDVINEINGETPSRRGRAPKPAKVEEAVVPEAVLQDSTPVVTPPAISAQEITEKPKRKRRTKAEMEAARAAELLSEAGDSVVKEASLVTAIKNLATKREKEEEFEYVDDTSSSENTAFDDGDYDD